MRMQTVIMAPRKGVGVARPNPLHHKKPFRANNEKESHEPCRNVKSRIVKSPRVTASGKLKRGRCSHSHILTKKTAKRKRRLRETTLIDAAIRSASNG